jgi:hypothetical protein
MMPDVASLFSSIIITDNYNNTHYLTSSTKSHNMSEQQTRVSIPEQTEQGSTNNGSTAAPTSEGGNNTVPTSCPGRNEQLLFASTEWSREVASLGGPGGEELAAKYGKDGKLSHAEWTELNDSMNARDARNRP